MLACPHATPTDAAQSNNIIDLRLQNCTNDLVRMHPGIPALRAGLSTLAAKPQ
jgi:hypothetical protein